MRSGRRREGISKGAGVDAPGGCSAAVGAAASPGSSATPLLEIGGPNGGTAASSAGAAGPLGSGAEEGEASSSIGMATTEYRCAGEQCKSQLAPVRKNRVTSVHSAAYYLLRYTLIHLVFREVT